MKSKKYKKEIYPYWTLHTYVIQKALMQKRKAYVLSVITLHVANIVNSCNTIYPRNTVCLRCIIVNNPRNGDNKEF